MRARGQNREEKDEARGLTPSGAQKREKGSVETREIGPGFVDPAVGTQKDEICFHFHLWRPAKVSCGPISSPLLLPSVSDKIFFIFLYPSSCRDLRAHADNRSGAKKTDVRDVLYFNKHSFFISIFSFAMRFYCSGNRCRSRDNS